MILPARPKLKRNIILFVGASISLFLIRRESIFYSPLSVSLSHSLKVPLLFNLIPSHPLVNIFKILVPPCHCHEITQPISTIVCFWANPPLSADVICGCPLSGLLTRSSFIHPFLSILFWPRRKKSAAVMAFKHS